MRLFDWLDRRTPDQRAIAAFVGAMGHLSVTLEDKFAGDEAALTVIQDFQNAGLKAAELEVFGRAQQEFILNSVSSEESIAGIEKAMSESVRVRRGPVEHELKLRAKSPASP